jgi:xylulose-5-phosphate/fructose-6-phosphate phosphoketolase
MAPRSTVVLEQINASSTDARSKGVPEAATLAHDHPRSPKGWTGPKWVDGKPIEGSFRSHQVPIAVDAEPPRAPATAGRVDEKLPAARSCSTRADCDPELAELAPKGERRMGANPHANGGLLLRDLRHAGFPRLRGEGSVARRVTAADTREQGELMRDVIAKPIRARNFRIFGPDEPSNRWGAVFEVTNRCSTADLVPGDDHVAPDGRVMEMLSEHQCEGWLEGYLLTGRHGFFQLLRGVHPHRRLDVQPARQVAEGDRWDLPWRRQDCLAELPAGLARVAQDHNGFTHQDPASSTMW